MDEWRRPRGRERQTQAAGNSGAARQPRRRLEILSGGLWRAITRVQGPHVHRAGHVALWRAAAVRIDAKAIRDASGRIGGEPAARRPADARGGGRNPDGRLLPCDRALDRVPGAVSATCVWTGYSHPTDPVRL